MIAKRILCAAVLTALINTCVFAQNEEVMLEGNTIQIQNDAKVFVNPWNSQKFIGVGEQGKILVLDKDKSIDIPVSVPLYKLSSAYKDKIIKKDGLWGIERNVVRKVFDGTEEWEQCDNVRYTNETTTLFSVKLPQKAKVPQGISTHFTVQNNIKDKNNTLDGLTIESDGITCTIRFMNVRNVLEIEGLKQYLLSQKEINNAVTLLYPADKPVFEPFEEDIQNKLLNVDISSLGFTDVVIDYNKEEKSLYSPFEEKNKFGNEKEIELLLDSVENIQIYNAEDNQKFWISKIKPYENGCYIEARYEGNDDEGVLKADIEYMYVDFLSEKPKEIVMMTGYEGKPIISLKIDFSRFKVPNKEYSDLLFEDTGIKNECIQELRFVTPDIIPIVDGQKLNIYFDNMVLNGRIGNDEEIKITMHNAEDSKSIELKKDKKDLDSGFYTDSFFTYTADGEAQWNQKIKIDNNESNIKWITVPQNAGENQNKKVLFIGDSLINENYYTQEIEKLFKDDIMKIEMLGTRGEDGWKHEGRGGWSAWDYCNLDTLYGFTNPFLNKDKFDFSYYMDLNKYDSVDYVFVNLGINDLNKLGHNTQEEIFNCYDEIINSIKEYDNNIKIFLGMPPVLFDTDNTLPMKNARLNFINALKEKYKFENNFYLVPLYVGLDPYLDFKLKEPVLSASSQDSRLIVTDTTHPGVSGYKRMAEITYNFIKYAAYENMDIKHRK